MRIGRLVTLIGALLLAASGIAVAQEAGKAGVTLGYPGAIGIIWHPTATVGIRPAFTFTHSSVNDSGSSSGGGVDLSVLFYMKKSDNVRPYVSPRFSYLRSTSTTTVTSTQGGIPDIKTTTTSTGGAGVFGAQYWPGSRFSIYGEAGVAFSHRKATSSAIIASNKNTGWGTTAGVGVVFYP